MTYDDEELIPLSALQHYIFCPRQCALIHVEQLWAENLFTAEGTVMHERAHEQGIEVRGDLRIERGVPLRSMQLGLSGKADVVEFRRLSDGTWLPFPVEYKRGRPKDKDCDKVQLCAQAICLEEMANVEVERGALFYGKIRRRADVVFDRPLREKTQEAARRVHELVRSGVTPSPEYSARCESCSLVGVCLPKAAGSFNAVKRYLDRFINEKAP